jgi:hypothetical protein
MHGYSKPEEIMLVFGGLDDSAGLTERIAKHLTRYYPNLDPQAYNPKPVVLGVSQNVAAAGTIGGTITVPTLTLFYGVKTAATFDNTAGNAAYPWKQPGTLITGTLSTPDGGLILGSNNNNFSYSSFSGDQVTRIEPFWMGAQQQLSLNVTNNEPILLTTNFTLYGVGCYTAGGPII